MLKVLKSKINHNCFFRKTLMQRLLKTSTRFNKNFKLPEHIQQIKHKRSNLKQQAKDDAATLFHLETSGFPREFVTNKIFPAIQTQLSPKLTSPLKIPVKSYVDQLNAEIFTLEQEYSSTKDAELLQLYTPAGWSFVSCTRSCTRLFFVYFVSFIEFYTKNTRNNGYSA